MESGSARPSSLKRRLRLVLWLLGRLPNTSAVYYPARAGWAPHGGRRDQPRIGLSRASRMAVIMVVAPSRTGPRDMGSRAPSAAAGANPYSPHPVPLVARAGLAEARAVPSCSSSYVEFEARPPWTVGSRFELHRRVSTPLAPWSGGSCR